MLALKSVSRMIGKFRHRHLVLRNINASFDRNQNYVVLAKRGAGKTTLVQVMAGLLSPTSGRVIRSGRISIPVGSLLPGELGRSVKSYIRLFCDLYAANFEEVLAYVVWFSDFNDSLEAPLASLPASVRARLGFAIGYAIPCDIYLFDNNIAYGDGEYRQRCRAAFDARRRTCGTIVVSSDTRNAIHLGDVGAVLSDGELAFYASVDDALDAFLRLTPEVEAAISGDTGAEDSGNGGRLSDLVQAARLALQHERAPAALEIAEVALRLSPGDPEVLRILATAADRTGDAQKAADAYRRLAGGKENRDFGLALRTYTRLSMWASVVETIDETQGSENSQSLLFQKANALAALRRFDQLGATLAKLAAVDVDAALRVVYSVARSGDAVEAPKLLSAVPRGQIASASPTRTAEVLRVALLHLASELDGSATHLAKEYIEAAVSLTSDASEIERLQDRIATLRKSNLE